MDGKGFSALAMRYFHGPMLGEGAYGEVYAMFHRSLGQGWSDGPDDSSSPGRLSHLMGRMAHWDIGYECYGM